MTDQPTTEEVRELLDDVNRCLANPGVPGCRPAPGMFVGERLPMLAALCNHYLAQSAAPQMSAGEFAGLVTKTLRQDVTEWAQLSRSRTADSQIAEERRIRTKQCDEDLREVLRLAREHNIEIKEPKP